MIPFLPPISSEYCLPRSAQAIAIFLPVAVEPVKDNILTSLCCTNGIPAVGPKPVTTLNTPAGNPAS